MKKIKLHTTKKVFALPHQYDRATGCRWRSTFMEDHVDRRRWGPSATRKQEEFEMYPSTTYPRRRGDECVGGQRASFRRSRRPKEKRVARINHDQNKASCGVCHGCKCLALFEVSI